MGIGERQNSPNWQPDLQSSPVVVVRPRWPRPDLRGGGHRSNARGQLILKNVLLATLRRHGASASALTPHFEIALLERGKGGASGRKEDPLRPDAIRPSVETGHRVSRRSRGEHPYSPHAARVASRGRP